jgi:PTS system glucose-specific IIA component
VFGSIFNNKNNNVNNHVMVKAPISGKVMDLSEVKDEVFASRMVGEGIAIDPSEGSLIAPFDGRVKQVFSTGHAVVLESKEGIAILIHIGLDTVNLKGEGFKVLVSEGQSIKTGDPIIVFDMDFIKNSRYHLQTPVVIPEGDNVKAIEFTKEKYVNKGKDLLMKVSLSM